MATNCTVVTPPATTLVSLADAKAMLLVDHSADDALITAMIAAATNEAQATAARSFVTRTLRLALDGWPANNVIRLWYPPALAVSAITYYDADNAIQTVAAADYVVITDTTPGIVVPAPGKAWPTSSLRDFSPIRITYTAGYGDAAAVAAAEPEIPQLIKALVVVDYENREALSATAATQRARILDALASRWGWAGNG